MVSRAILLLAITATAISAQLVEVRVSVQLPTDKDCTCDNGLAGKCKLLKECTLVYREVLQGHIPSKTCGFIGLDPVVCCPNVASKDYHLPPAATDSSTKKHNNPFLANTYLPPYQQNRAPSTTTNKSPCQVDNVTPDSKVFYPTESSAIIPDDDSGNLPISLFSRVDTDEPETSATSNTDTEIKKNIEEMMKKLATIQDKINRVKMNNNENVGSVQIPARFTVESRIPGVIAQEKCQEFEQRICPKGDKVSLNVEDEGFAHMAAIGYKGAKNTTLWLCSGSIVSEAFILAPAHCHTNAHGRAVLAKVGDFFGKSTLKKVKPEMRMIIDIFTHPLYKYPSEYHDIALYKLDKQLGFSSYIRPACLSPYRTNYGIVNNTVRSVGWKKDDWTSEKPKELLAVSLTLVDHTTCNETYFTGAFDPKYFYGIVDQWQVCVGEGRDSCQGDSGSNVIQKSKQFNCMYDVIGVSNIERRCNSNVPGIYSRVNSYLPWLEKEIWGHEIKN